MQTLCVVLASTITNNTDAETGLPVHCTWNTLVDEDSMIKVQPYSTSPDLVEAHSYAIVDVWGPGGAPTACTDGQSIKVAGWGTTTGSPTFHSFGTVKAMGRGEMPTAAQCQLAIGAGAPLSCPSQGASGPGPHTSWPGPSPSFSTGALPPAQIWICKSLIFKMCFFCWATNFISTWQIAKYMQLQ